MENARPLVCCDEMQQVMLCCLHLALSEDIWIMAVNLYRCQQHNLIVLYVCDRIDPESSVSEYLGIGSQWLFLNHSRQNREGGSLLSMEDPRLEYICTMDTCSIVPKSCPLIWSKWTPSPSFAYKISPNLTAATQIGRQFGR